MKTAERILLTSLEMFNEQGEANVTCVDIALELDISPGNLYYHFKGKEVIVAALFDMYRERMDKILLSPGKDALTVEDFFFYLLLILESSHIFRFLYRNPNDLAEKYTTVAKGFKRLLVEKEKTFVDLFKHFHQDGKLRCDEQQQQKLVELIGLVFTQSLNYYSLKGVDIDEDDVSYDSLGVIFYALSPYLILSDENLISLHQSITEQNIG